MHNDIMAVGSKERPPMLAPEVPAKGDNPGQLRVVREETYINTTPENRKLIDAKAEVIHMILNGIGNDIYSTVDACPYARKMNNLKVDTMQVNVQFLQQLQPEWSRFVTIVKQHQDLDTVSFHKLFDILKQHQNEVNEIRVERIARIANPHALVATTQHYPDDYTQSPKPYKTHAHSSRQTPLTRTHATTRNKGKEIVKQYSSQSELASEEDNDEEQARRDKQMKKSLAHFEKHFKNIYKPTNNNIMTLLNTKNKNVDTSLRTRNDRQIRQFRNQRTVTVAGNRETKPKRVKDYDNHKEKMMLCKQESKGIPLNAEQNEWLQDTDEEPHKQELEAHYMYMAKIQEVLHVVDDISRPTYDAEPLEKVHTDDDYNVFANEKQHFEQPESINHTYELEKTDRNVIFDSSNMYDNEGKADQNVNELEDARAFLASLIANLKLDVDENKMKHKQLKKANMPLTQELEKSKQDLFYCKCELKKYKNF
nr:hypothetical protein [Tanacetum cinerariifolium]